MKIGVFAIPEITIGKHNIKDTRLDEVDNFTKAKKKTYIQIETVEEGVLLEADAILASVDARADLILKDLEFVETRLGRSSDDAEKGLLNRMKSSLEKEKFLNSIEFTPQERQMMSAYNLLTVKPVVLAEQKDLENANTLLARAMKEGGFISFFTTGEKETRAWLIPAGINAHEAAGAIHSDIQKGFIRAEIISFNDFIQCGGETKAKQAGKMRLENKDYVMQDADLVNFRFNK